MDRMKTFLTYVLLIIVFFIVSVLLENGLLLAMYSDISVEFYGNYLGNKFGIENISAKASNVNGYLDFDLTNPGQNFIGKCYLKVDLYNEQDLLADTEYIEVKEMKPGENKNFQIKFKANNIEKFSISVVENTPDKTNIINILGWEIDLTNVFGLGIDLSNVTIFGTKLTDIFTWNNIIKTRNSFWAWLISIVQSVPGWAYFLALFFII